MLEHMAINLHDQWVAQLRELRYLPTAKRLRASRDGELVCETDQALLVWRPDRVVPEYAVPADALPTDASALGTPLDEPGLQGHVLLAFDDFDWLEEDESGIGHPHDPFGHIDVRRSSRHVRVELDGVVLAESRHPSALFETHLPTRWYLPVNDVHTDLLQPSETQTTCAYKGHASYLSAKSESGRDIAWFYRHPLREAEPIRDLICFYAERTVTTVDGVRDPGFVPPPGMSM